jgi:hypothetical protein
MVRHRNDSKKGVGNKKKVRDYTPARIETTVELYTPTTWEKTKQFCQENPGTVIMGLLGFGTQAFQFGQVFIKWLMTL